MQTTKKRTETVIDTTTLLIWKKTDSGMPIAWCSKCAAEVLWVESSEIGLLGIFHMPDRKEIHMNGRQACVRSLIQEVKKEKI